MKETVMKLFLFSSFVCILSLGETPLYDNAVKALSIYSSFIQYAFYKKKKKEHCSMCLTIVEVCQRFSVSWLFSLSEPHVIT